MAHDVRLSHTVGLASARCEGCGLAYQVDDLRVRGGEPVLVCPDCGCPVYLVGSEDLEAELVPGIEDCRECVELGSECAWHCGFGAGWDACAAEVRRAVETEHWAELVAWEDLEADVADGVA